MNTSNVLTRRLLAATLAASGTVVAFAQAQAPAKAPQQQPAPAVAKTHLKAGDVAPDFKLKSYDGKSVKLSSYRGKKNVVLAFYVLAHTGG